MPAGYTVALRCATNDGETAVGVCHLCRHPVCDLCIATREGDLLVCRRCAYREAVEDPPQVRTPPAQPETASRKNIAVDHYTKGTWRLVLAVLALSVMDLVMTVNYPETGGWLALSIVNIVVTLVGLTLILMRIRLRRLRLSFTILFCLNIVLVLYDFYQHTMLSLHGA